MQQNIGNEYEFLHVAKLFEGKLYTGMVVGMEDDVLDPTTQGRQRAWKIIYEDGDTEDMFLPELEQCRSLYLTTYKRRYQDTELPLSGKRSKGWVWSMVYAKYILPEKLDDDKKVLDEDVCEHLFARHEIDKDLVVPLRSERPLIADYVTQRFRDCTLDNTCSCPDCVEVFAHGHK
jgi:hypothetical protein